MRYMMHCHRREWLESILSQISADKIPGIVKLLDNRYKLNQVLIGEYNFVFNSYHNSLTSVDYFL